MYQKSPFPYLIVLVAIIGISSFTNLTIDKEIEQPIIHVIQENSNIDPVIAEKPTVLKNESTQIASVQ